MVKDLNKMKVNIIVFELCKITQLREQLHESLQHIQESQDVIVGNTKATSKGKHVKVNRMNKTSSVINTFMDDKAKTTDDKKKGDPRPNGALIGIESGSQIPPFLLTFEIFNCNVHNYLVDFGALSNVMHYSVCKKLNIEP